MNEYIIRYIQPDGITGNVQNADGARVDTNCVDMAITYALSMSNQFTDVTYMVMRLKSPVDVVIGVAHAGNWVNHLTTDKEDN